jgi:predicted AlkP superfamily pyrophosphatase or phosphodiesterase
MLARLTAFLCFLCLAACAGTQTPAPPPAERILLVSIDGFRADYLDRPEAAPLRALAKEGASAAMRPSFPSVTFPNHYTLVTGLAPDRHGIVNNSMEDPAHPGLLFKLSDTAVISQPFWWEGGEPIWVTAEKAGVRSATMFWPGSDFEIKGARPRDWVKYDMKMPGDARVDRVLTWLDKPAAERPRFLTLYFDVVDSAGHNFGPDAPETNAAIAQVNGQIARLIDGLKARGLYDSTDLVIVADHGMAAISPERVVNVDDFIPADAAKLVWSGPIAALIPAPGKQAAIEPLLGRHGRMECWRKENIPARFRFGANPRIPPIFCLADNGWLISSKAQPTTYLRSKGAHGYDGAASDMAALFLARGPSFKPGVKLGSFDNVDVHPLLARSLRISAPKGDGSLDALRPALR